MNWTTDTGIFNLVSWTAIKKWGGLNNGITKFCTEYWNSFVTNNNHRIRPMTEKQRRDIFNHLILELTYAEYFLQTGSIKRPNQEKRAEYLYMNNPQFSAKVNHQVSTVMDVIDGVLGIENAHD